MKITLAIRNYVKSNDFQRHSDSISFQIWRQPQKLLLIPNIVWSNGKTFGFGMKRQNEKQINQIHIERLPTLCLLWAQQIGDVDQWNEFYEREMDETGSIRFHWTKCLNNG